VVVGIAAELDGTVTASWAGSDVAALEAAALEAAALDAAALETAAFDLGVHSDATVTKVVGAAVVAAGATSAATKLEAAAVLATGTTIAVDVDVVGVVKPVPRGPW
jgi:hypothetical protein